VRITAQLIYAPEDKNVWARTYERQLQDALTLQSAVASAIAEEIRVQMAPREQPRASSPRPVNLKALDAYLQGSYHLNKADMAPRDEQLRKAGEYFQNAIDADPSFTPAYTGLANAHENLWWPSSDDFGIMRRAAEKAAALDPTSSDARIAVGNTKFDDFDWPGAEEDYRRAITLNPNNAHAHKRLGDLLDTMGRMEEGWKEYQIAQELDPIQDHLSDGLYLRGEYDAAMALLLKDIESRPEDALAHWFLSQNYLQKGMYKEWMQELGKCMTLMGLPEIAGRLHVAFATSGYPGALREQAHYFEQLKANKQAYFPGILAQAYAALGDKDRAFYWLGEGCAHYHLALSDPFLTGLKVDPGFASLRSDARYKDLLRRMGLPP
jgi:tetratricopeptide (TPR) repeat protein